MRDYAALDQQQARDIAEMTYKISAPLHHCTDTPQCQTPTTCTMCFSAARLVIQNYRPILEKRFVEQVGRLFNIPTGYVPPSSD